MPACLAFPWAPSLGNTTPPRSSGGRFVRERVKGSSKFWRRPGSYLVSFGVSCSDTISFWEQPIQAFRLSLCWLHLHFPRRPGRGHFHRALARLDFPSGPAEAASGRSRSPKSQLIDYYSLINFWFKCFLPPTHTVNVFFRKGSDRS